MCAYIFKPKDAVLHGQNFLSLTSFPHEFGFVTESSNHYIICGFASGGVCHFVEKDLTKYLNSKALIYHISFDEEPIELNTKPGLIFNRIHRPVATPAGHNIPLEDEDAFNSSFRSLKLLLEKFDDLFNYIEPALKNKEVYGPLTRELLILACTEVESSMRAVLRENNYPSCEENLSTKDFCKLLEPMFLDSYTLSLHQYEDFSNITPFKDWDKHKPTKSLSWYSAYNSVKHNREKNLSQATMENVIYAVSAAVIIFYAQFGTRIGQIGSKYHWKYLYIKSIFDLQTDFSKYKKDYYFPDISRGFGEPEKYNNWRTTNFKFK